jgi:hypothetical protein
VPASTLPPRDVLPLPPSDPLPGLDAPRPALLLVAGTTAITLGVLALPWPSLGVRLTVVVVAFHLAVLAASRRPGLAGWADAWLVLAPLSVLMVLPDWFLSAELGTLAFPDTGAAHLGTVPVFMAGMWTMALFPLVVVGAVVERRSGPRAAVVAVAVSGLALFWAAEALAPVIPLWEPVGVRLVAGVAGYVLPAEVVLAVAAWLLVRGVRVRSRGWTAVGVALLPMVYLGLLATGYQLLG